MCFFPTEEKSSLLNQILLQNSEETGYPRIFLCLSHKSIQFVLKKSQLQLLSFLSFVKEIFLVGVTAAILLFQNNETAAMLVFQPNLLGLNSLRM